MPLDFDEAESIFSSILHTDPHRIDSLDLYSNILFVMVNRPKLAFLAQIATATDKFRPETCCVIGNYYSLKSEHEKAVIYFRRALTLDRNFLSAWILMGHEYLEMKNTHAAIESYRRAVDINRKDYRAWFGLGQTYEILDMPLYGLFYYQRAASLRPYDPKMWSVIGQCYDKIDRPLQAIKAYKRSLVASTFYDQNAGSASASATTSFASSQGTVTARGIDGGQSHGSDAPLDPDTLFSIATLYEKLDNIDEAAAYMEMTVAQEDGAPTAPIRSHRHRRQRQEDSDDEGAETESDHDNQDASSSSSSEPAAEEDDSDRPLRSGTGVTGTTSKARMWLARWSFAKGNMHRALELANELCEDGFEVEEAKALIRDLKARMEANVSPR